MKILEITPIFKKTAGIERVAYELSKNFINLGNEVFILTQKVEVPLKKARFIYEKPSEKFLLRLKKEKNLDVIHSHGSASLFCDILTMHGCHKAYVKTASLLRKVSPRNHLTIWREKRAIKNAKIIIAVSNLVKKQLIEEYKIPESKIKVIYNGVNLNEFYFKRKFNKLNRKEIKLLFVANYFERKGLRELLCALSLIKDKPFKLLIAGKDNPAPYIKLSKELGIENKIVFLGLCKNISKLYRMCDVFCFPTKMEPCALAELEAMASGLALVVSDTRVNGVAELLKDGEDSFLIKDPTNPKEIAEKISILLDDLSLIKKFSRKVQMKAMKMDWKNVAAKYLKIFEELK
jgi:UDP-glucose:(heptosyl)LPS alpha-1,3-glucosyltransferase